MSVSARRFRELALALPEAEEGAHMGHPDFRVRNRIFASLTADEKRGAVRCEAANVDALARSDPATYRDAWGGRWLGIDLAHAPDAAVAGLLEDAWRLVAPKRTVAEFARRHSGT